MIKNHILLHFFLKWIQYIKNDFLVNLKKKKKKLKFEKIFKELYEKKKQEQRKKIKELVLKKKKK